MQRNPLVRMWHALRATVDTSTDDNPSAHRPPRLRKRKSSDPARAVVAVIPAHNEESSIAGTLDSVLAQTYPVAHTFVIANGCTDRTEEIVLSYRDRGVTLVRAVGVRSKVGALMHAWDLIGGLGYDYWLGADADTILDPACVKDLADEIADDSNIGGVMARYSFDQSRAHGLTSSFLYRMQRLEFAGWTSDLLHRNRQTYVLGGQATLFRMGALAKVAAIPGRGGPWSDKTLVEDMEITWKITETGHTAVVSKTARAWPDAMPSWGALWGQRRKWDQGMALLLKQHGRTPETAVPWRIQMKSLLDFLIRAGFITMLSVSLVFSMFTWFWIWLVPAVLAVLLNIQVATEMPRRTWADVLTVGTLIGTEVYLVFRLACWSVSWVGVLRGQEFDGWAKQYAAERGGGKSLMLRRLALVAATIGGLVWAAWYWQWLPRLRIWQSEHGPWVADLVAAGWWVLTILTVIATLEMVYRLFRSSSGMRP